MDTCSRGGSHGRSGSRGGKEWSEGFVCKGGQERPPEQPLELKETIEEEVVKAFHDVLLTLPNVREESNQKWKQHKILEKVSNSWSNYEFNVNK